jgi:transcriptional regulator with XRE-family HTH domain
MLWDGLMAMEFPQRLAALRKEKGLTQQVLADAVGVHVTQLRRYEAGTSQPTLAVLRKLAVALSVSADVLLFEAEERGPHDDLRLQFEALETMSEQDRSVIASLIDAFIKKHQIEHVLGR